MNSIGLLVNIKNSNTVLFGLVVELLVAIGYGGST